MAYLRMLKHSKCYLCCLQSKQKSISIHLKPICLSVVLFSFFCFFGNVTEEHQGHLKYKHPQTSQGSNVTVSLQFPPQLLSCVSTKDNALHE